MRLRAIIAVPGFGGVMIRLGCLGVAAIALACDVPPPQSSSQLTYQNGYAQTTPQYGPQTSLQQGYPQQPLTTPPVTYTPLVTPQAQVMVEQPSTVTPPPPVNNWQTPPPVQVQTTPVPLGVQALPPPTPMATSMTSPQQTMAVPDKNAYPCSTDAQCGVGRCNMAYRKCAYPCRRSEVDCTPGNVCTGTGLCLPKGVAGLSM
jgi:hypothetical protein